MKLSDLLLDHESAIARRWLDQTLATYPADAAGFFQRERDQFANPVGQAIATGIQQLVRSLVREPLDPAVLCSHLDRILRIRSVQEFTPSQAVSFVFLLKAAIRDADPVLFIEHKLLYGARELVPVAEEVAPIGKARVVRGGSDVTIAAYGYMVALALLAAEALAEQGVSAEVLDLRTLKPLDEAAVLESVSKTMHLVTVEEGWTAGGIGAVAVVFYDESYGTIARIQQRQYGREVGAALHNPDFVRMAEAFGAHGQRVETPEQLYEALCAAWEREGPTVIEVPLEAEVGFA